MNRINHSSRFISQFGNLLPSHTIGEVAEVYDGTHQTPNYVSEGIRFVSVEDINDLYNSKKFISEADYQKYKHVPTVGDIIMTRIGSIGKCAIVDREEPLAYYVSVSLLKLNHDMIDSRYLRYYLESDFGDKELKLRSLLKAFPMKINLKEIPQVRLILPEIAEQIKFVDVVKQADKSKFSDFKSRFIEECYSRYPKQKLGGHISVIRGVSYKPSDVRSSVDEGVAIILRSNNIADGEINFDDLVYVVQERVQNEQKLKPGDIVMCGSNGSIGLVGKAGLLKDNMPNTAFGAFCLGIKCKETILPEYLNTYFNTQVYRNEIESMGNGTNIINIRPDNITNLFIPIPPVEKQMAFVEVVNQADKSKYLN